MGLTYPASAFAYATHVTFFLAFQDDELIRAATVQEHDSALDQLLKRASDNVFRFNLAKCEFCVQQVTFLGRRVK